jgi:phage N-6-adenine-methyltransferase|tara:strand:- start:25 stop:492 length:468 start_codon:yes stop_codon:yes gene_type:complete
MKSKSVQHLESIKVNDEYGTPHFLFLENCLKFDCSPAVDYFASDKNHVLDKYYTKKDDAFKREWYHNGFCNFPYSMMEKCLKKAWEEHEKYGIEIMILCYAKTDTKWWHEYVEGKAEYHFQKGRIKFLDGQGNLTKNSSPYPSVWIIIRGKNATG